MPTTRSGRSPKKPVATVDGTNVETDVHSSPTISYIRSPKKQPEATSGRKRKKKSTTENGTTNTNHTTTTTNDDSHREKKIKLSDDTLPPSIDIVTPSPIVSPSTSNTSCHSPPPTVSIDMRSPQISATLKPAAPPSHTKSHHATHTPLPLPLAFDEDEEQMNDDFNDRDIPIGANLSAAFASAASAIEPSILSASSGAIPAASKEGAHHIHKVRSTGLGDAKPFKPPTRIVRADAPGSQPLSLSQRSSASPADSPAPPSQEFVAQKVRNRGKHSSLDAIITGLETDVAKGGTEVDPDVMMEAVDEAVGGFSSAAANSSNIAAVVPPERDSAAPSSPALSTAKLTPRIKFTTNAQLQSFLLSLLNEQCCLPTTGASIAAVLNDEYDVADTAIDTQLNKLVAAGKLERKTITLDSTGGDEDDSMGIPQRVDIVWMQPMELPSSAPTHPSKSAMMSEQKIEEKAVPPPPSLMTPQKSSPTIGANSGVKSPGSTVASPSPPSDTAVSASPALPSMTPSASNHLSKTSSALKARLSKSRARPSLLTVGQSTAVRESPPDTINVTPAKPTSIPWTVLAAEAAASSTTPTTPSTSSLTPEQHAAIQTKKEAALNKRRSLLTPKVSQAVGETTPATPLSIVDQLQSQLRAKQSQVAKLREQKFIHVDSAKTAETEALTEKWTVTAQEVLIELLTKVQQSRPVTMDALLRDLQVDPKQVRWNEVENDFE